MGKRQMGWGFFLQNICCTHLDSGGKTLVFSVDEVFSYSVVERRGITVLGPTVRLPFVGSYFDVVVVLGFAGLELAASHTEQIRILAKYTVLIY